MLPCGRELPSPSMSVWYSTLLPPPRSCGVTRQVWSCCCHSGAGSASHRAASACRGAAPPVVREAAQANEKPGKNRFRYEHSVTETKLAATEIHSVAETKLTLTKTEATANCLGLGLKTFIILKYLKAQALKYLKGLCFLQLFAGFLPRAISEAEASYRRFLWPALLTKLG